MNMMDFSPLNESLRRDETESRRSPAGEAVGFLLFLVVITAVWLIMVAI